MPAPMAFCEKGRVRSIGQDGGLLRAGRAAARACALLGCLTAMAPFAGCEKPTAENIQVWKPTEKGPGKLAQALRARGEDAKMRAPAAKAMVGIGKSDEVEAARAAMPPSERVEVVRALVPLYVGAMGPGAGATPEKTLAARDALFSLRGLASPEEQAQNAAALMHTHETDLR